MRLLSAASKMKTCTSRRWHDPRQASISENREREAEAQAAHNMAVPAACTAGEAKVPTRHSIDDGPSPEGSDDIARILAVVAFNGVCRLITSAARSGILSRCDVEGLHDAMTDPLDNPEVRDDEVIACARDTLETVLSNALVEVGGHDCT